MWPIIRRGKSPGQPSFAFVVIAAGEVRIAHDRLPRDRGEATFWAESRAEAAMIAGPVHFIGMVDRPPRAMPPPSEPPIAASR